MLNKTLFSVLLLTIIFASFAVHSNDVADSPKLSFTIGATHLTNEGFDALKGSGRTVDNDDDATQLMVGYRLRPNIDIEFGFMNLNEISSSIYNGASGKLHGKNFSVCTECSSQSGGNNENPLELIGEFETSFLFGLKYNLSFSNNINVHIKTGMLFWDASYTATGSKFKYDGIDKSGRFLEVDGSDPYFGIGASYELNNKSAIAFNYLFSEVFGSKISGPSLSWIQNF